jgi:hypothetical protein
VQPLELALRHRVKIDPTNALLGTRPLQPTQKGLGGTRIGDGALAQAALDLRVGRRLPCPAGCAATTETSRGEAHRAQGYASPQGSASTEVDVADAGSGVGRLGAARRSSWGFVLALVGLAR